MSCCSVIRHSLKSVWIIESKEASQQIHRWCHILTMSKGRVLVCYDTHKDACSCELVYESYSTLMFFGDWSDFESWSHPHALMQQKPFDIFFLSQCLKIVVSDFEFCMSKAVWACSDTICVKETKWLLWSKLVDLLLLCLYHNSKRLFLYATCVLNFTIGQSVVWGWFLKNF